MRCGRSQRCNYRVMLDKHDALLLKYPCIWKIALAPQLSSRGKQRRETACAGDGVGKGGMFMVHASRTRRQHANPPDSETIAGVAAERSDQQPQSTQVKGTA